MAGKSFGIPAILFYQASDANKNKRGGRGTTLNSKTITKINSSG
jgi:hypothetical protein